MMTFDELEKGLVRLTERHEALTESVELLVHQQQQWFAEMRSWQKEVDKNHQKNQKLIAEVLESITSLARIAHDHERRISDLEDKP